MTMDCRKPGGKTLLGVKIRKKLFSVKVILTMLVELAFIANCIEFVEMRAIGLCFL